jgi:C-terminal processing protease CtpA/Prc
MPGGLSVAAVQDLCEGDALCAAQELVAASGGRARLQKVEHPDSDTIRWVNSAPSVAGFGRMPDGRAWLALDRFGRKAADELRGALEDLRTDAGALDLVLDLRGNGGGDFGRMMKLAAVFTGEVKNGLYLIGVDGRMPVGITGESKPEWLDSLTVVVGPRTASSGEVLAGLLHRYAGAELVGEPTAGKDYIVRVIPVDHDWRLLVPAETIEVPGVVLRGGLRPRRAWPNDGLSP